MISSWNFLHECGSLVKNIDPKKYWIAEDLQNNEALHYSAGFKFYF